MTLFKRTKCRKKNTKQLTTSKEGLRSAATKQKPKKAKSQTKPNLKVREIFSCVCKTLYKQVRRDRLGCNRIFYALTTCKDQRRRNTSY